MVAVKSLAALPPAGAHGAPGGPCAAHRVDRLRWNA